MAEVSATTINTASRSMINRIGPSHHFFRYRIKYHSSAKIEIFPESPINISLTNYT